MQEYSGENSSSLNLSTADEIATLKSRCDVLAMTAQVFLNKLAAGFPISWCSLLVFDEAHHASGSHPFARILNEYYRVTFLEERPHLLGLTASPGGKSSMERTQLQLGALSQAFCGAQFRVPNHHWQQLEELTATAATVCVPVLLSAEEQAFRTEVMGYLHVLLEQVQLTAASSGYVDFVSNFSVDLPEGLMRGELRKLLDFACAAKVGPLRAAVEHAQEIMSVLGRCHVFSPTAARRELGRYLERVRCSKELAAKMEVIRGLRWPVSWTSRGDEEGTGVEWSTRMAVLIEEVVRSMDHNSHARVLVFVQKRSTAHLVAKLLGQVAGLRKVRAATLVGHSGFDGMSWVEEQKPVLDRFRSGVYRLLVATSVAEEGLDVPACNLVIRFDGAVSMTAVIQSRGRARKRGSRFLVLVDREEKMVWEASCAEERCMMRAIRTMQQGAAPATAHLSAQIQGAILEWRRGGGGGGREAVAEVQGPLGQDPGG